MRATTKSELVDFHHRRGDFQPRGLRRATGLLLPPVKI
jgi:hypothetical protein